MHPKQVVPSFQDTSGVSNCRSVEAWIQQRPKNLVSVLEKQARNVVTEVKQIGTLLGPKPRFTNPHDKAQVVDDKAVQNATKFVIGRLCRPWRKVKRKDDKEETICVLTRHNYKI